MSKLFLIGLGGFVGAIARYGLSDGVHRLLGVGFPYGTLVVNVLGCVLLGFGVTLAEQRLWITPELRALWFIGGFGAFTTFSTFSYETFQLLRAGSVFSAGLNVLSSVVVGLFAIWVGYTLARMV